MNGHKQYTNDHTITCNTELCGRNIVLLANTTCLDHHTVITLTICGMRMSNNLHLSSPPAPCPSRPACSWIAVDAGWTRSSTATTAAPPANVFTHTSQHEWNWMCSCHSLKSNIVNKWLLGEWTRCVRLKLEQIYYWF